MVVALACGVPAALGAALDAGAAEAGAAEAGAAEAGAAEADAALDGAAVGAATCGAAEGTGAFRLTVAAGVGVDEAAPQAASRAVSDTAPPSAMALRRVNWTLCSILARSR